eukprot:contig_8608_g2018
MRCFNCDDPKHTINDCPLPHDVARAALKRLEYLSKRKAGRDATSQVLFELCTQMNESTSKGAQEADTDANATKQHDEAEADTLFATLVHAMRIPITDCFMILIEVDVVDINVPLILGLDFLDEHKMYVNNTTNMLVCVNEGIQVPLVRKTGHIFFEWGAVILYTFPELQRIHKHFFHAIPERLDAVLHVVDCDTLWSAAGFMGECQTVDATWNMFVKIWRERSKALVEAGTNMVRHVARARLSTALRRNVPKASDNEIHPCMRVLVYREKPIDEWQGPYTVHGHDGKHAWLDINDRLKLFSIDKIKEYLPPLEAGAVAAAVATVDPPSEPDMGSVVDAIIAGDTLLCNVGQRFGSIQEKAYRDTHAEVETPQKTCQDRGAQARGLTGIRRGG